MFDSLTSLFDFDFSSWVSEIVGFFTSTNTIGEDTVETIADAPWSAFVPWPQLFGFVALIVMIVLIFKFMRSVLCRIF